MLYTKMYFDTFRHGSKYGGKGKVGSRIMADVAKAILAKASKGQGDGQRKPRHKA